MAVNKTKTAADENPLADLIINIVIPTLVLLKFSTPERLGPRDALIVALAFPIVFMIYKFIKTRKANPIAIVGFVSVLLTGGLGLLKLDGFWFAVKEAMVPSLFAFIILASVKWDSPLAHMFFYNEKFIDIEKVNIALTERNTHQELHSLLTSSTVFLAGSFFLSAILNFSLALVLLKGQSGTPEFNTQLAKMHAYSFPVVAVPCVATMMLVFRRLLKGIERITGLTSDSIFKK